MRLGIAPLQDSAEALANGLHATFEVLSTGGGECKRGYEALQNVPLPCPFTDPGPFPDPYGGGHL